MLAVWVSVSPSYGQNRWSVSYARWHLGQNIGPARNNSPPRGSQAGKPSGREVLLQEGRGALPGEVGRVGRVDLGAGVVHEGVVGVVDVELHRLAARVELLLDR